MEYSLLSSVVVVREGLVFCAKGCVQPILKPYLRAWDDDDDNFWHL